MNAPDREKALQLALAQIEKSHGKGSVMRLGDDTRPPVGIIPTGSIALDVALGVGVHVLEGVHVRVVVRVDGADRQGGGVHGHAGHGRARRPTRANGLSACRAAGRTRVRVRWWLQTTPSGGSPQPAPRIPRAVGGPV